VTELYEDRGHVPFGPAAGAINGCIEEEMEAKIIDVARSYGRRKIKWGSTSWAGGLGNSGRTYHHNEITGITVNAMGLPNIGHPRAKKFQKKMQPVVEEYGMSLVPSFSPGVGEDPFTVLPDMAYGFVEAGATEIEVNLSCPNKLEEGGKAVEPVLGHDLDASFEIAEKVLETVGPGITVDFKEPPMLGEKKVLIEDVADRFIMLGGVFVKNKIIVVPFNTIGNQSVLDEWGEPALSVGEKGINVGGASGVAFAKMARAGLAKFRTSLPPETGITSSVGAADGAEVYLRVDEMGADDAEGVTIFWENERKGISFGETITRVAEQYFEIKVRHEEQSP